MTYAERLAAYLLSGLYHPAVAAILADERVRDRRRRPGQ